jgi:hypothetical protein
VIWQRRDIAVNLDPVGRGGLWPSSRGASSVDRPSIFVLEAI